MVMVGRERVVEKKVLVMEDWWLLLELRLLH